MDQDATWYGGKPRPRRRCVRRDRSSPLKGQQPPVFGSCLLWPNGWMDEDTTWYGSRSRLRPHCIRRGPSSPRKGHSSPLLFSADVYCGHGRSSQQLLSSCLFMPRLICIRFVRFSFLWPPYGIGQALYFCPVVSFFLSSIFFPRLISAAADWMSTILLHMEWP